MRALPVTVALVFVASCRKPPPELPPENAGSEIANQRLHDHIVRTKRKVFVESLGDDVLWSDGAMLERARSFPKPVQQLLEHPTKQADVPISESALSALLQNVDRRRAEWHPAKLARKDESEHACEVSDGDVRADVDCIYANYFEARYPGAKFLLKGKLDTVVIMDGDKIRGALMPMKL